MPINIIATPIRLLTTRITRLKIGHMERPLCFDLLVALA
jgi:hypothetical protein